MMVAGQHGTPRLGTDAAVYQMLKFGAITCVVMLILGILAAGSEFRHRTIVPVLLATPHRARVFAVKVAVTAVLGAVFAALVFGLGLGTVVLTLSVHGIHHLPAGVGQLYLGTVISSACFGMIGVALGALTRNTIGAIVAAIAWTLFVEQVLLAAIVPGIEKWLPTGAAIGLTNAPGPGPGHSLSPAAAGAGARRLRDRLAPGGEPHHHQARCGLTQATSRWAPGFEPRGPALRSGLRSGQAGVESSAGDRRHRPADP